MTTIASGVISAAELGAWVRGQLATDTADAIHIVRVITQEIGRWFDGRATAAELDEIVGIAADTGDTRWDALIEGITARGFHGKGRTAPAWTERTRLQPAWAPTGGVIRDPHWQLLDVISTPVELLDRGVILARQNFDRL